MHVMPLVYSDLILPLTLLSAQYLLPVVLNDPSFVKNVYFYPLPQMHFLIKLSLTILVLYLLYTSFPFDLFLNDALFAYLGSFLCFILNAIGTTKGMLAISRTCAGASIFNPKIGSKSLVGVIICEGNLLCGIVISYFIFNSIPHDSKNLKDVSYILFGAGTITGAVGFASSFATGIICAAICVMDAKDPKLFSKLVFYEFLAGSLGVMGIGIGFIMKEKIKIFV
ncbi:hypothetical protein VCUG_00658 [Vavraia culicis subsp. floridensis]|uniref:V-ATPase proteolipid subunit C-like domain-containing protein n=1 Tax=Vavraia culicis (isolate floridensis) TaxID=948595 RepID=L2GVW4_VAVCU|nr:uncharacterized protein VCUG_00658 [Vavraia culicis subsp. floridensis]ELA47816.1 hypothetical protein VCUG_00658 [Vavraia culicis subsp. floridensis]